MAEEKPSEKPSATWLAIEDYFNYYLPGVIWAGDILALLYTFQQEPIWNDQPGVKGILENHLVLVGIGLVAPFLIGVMLSGFGNMVHTLDKWIFGEPEKYVLNDKGLKGDHGLGKKFRTHLGKDLSEKTRQIIAQRFGSDLKSDSLYYTVQYSLEFAPFATIQTHVTRLTNLINLHEGLIPPLLGGVILAFVSSYTSDVPELKILGAILIIVALGVWWRYHYLREARAMRVFRYFYLWNTIAKSEDSQKKPDGATWVDRLKKLFD
jgi:hypothetical protein